MRFDRDATYVYVWGNNAKRATLKGRPCRVLAEGRKNSIMVKFRDTGQREIVSAHALRLKHKHRRNRAKR
jgi:hypothetical protein